MHVLTIWLYEECKLKAQANLGNLFDDRNPKGSQLAPVSS
jgi:hypothetical protein